MPNQLTAAHIEGERRLRVAVTGAVATIWNRLPGYNAENVDPWLSQVLPIVAASQRQSVRLTEAYLARVLGRQPLGLNPERLTGPVVRNGTSADQVYRRPFVRLWKGLSEGKLFEDASAAALAQATASAAMDVQLAARETFAAVQEADEGIYGYERVADGGACEFCQAVNGAYVKSADAMALHNNCITGDSAVWVPASDSTQASGFRRAHAATRRWYEGEIVVLETAAGYELTVTSNHPILTDRGWIAAGLLREGDSVVSSRGFDGVGGRVPDEEHVPARIEDRFRASAMAPLASVPFASEQFHGDRGDGEVNVVALHGGLDTNDLRALLEPPKHLPLSLRLQAGLRFACECGAMERRFRGRAATDHRMSRRNSCEALRSGLSGGGDPVLLARGSFTDTRPLQPVVDGSATDRVVAGEFEHGGPGSVGIGHTIERTPAVSRDSAGSEFAQDGLLVQSGEVGRLLGGFTGEVELDSLVLVSRRHLAAHVFNLVTNCGWYVAGGIVTHNCGCSLEPLTEPHPRAAKLPSGVAVHEHGELGPVLGSPDHDFTTEAQALG